MAPKKKTKRGLFYFFFFQGKSTSEKTFPPKKIRVLRCLGELGVSEGPKTNAFFKLYKFESRSRLSLKNHIKFPQKSPPYQHYILDHISGNKSRIGSIEVAIDREYPDEELVKFSLYAH